MRPGQQAPIVVWAVSAEELADFAWSRNAQATQCANLVLSCRGIAERTARGESHEGSFRSSQSHAGLSFALPPDAITAAVKELTRDRSASRNLGEEEQRHVREQMTEEALVVFDLLTRPAPELSAAERRGQEGCPRPAGPDQALAGLELATAVHCPRATPAHHRGRARHRLAGIDTPDLYQQNCAAVFEHVYESSPGRYASVY